MAVVAPVSARRCSATVSHLPRGDWRIGAPFYFCALVQFAALVLAWPHFTRPARAAGRGRRCHRCTT